MELAAVADVYAAYKAASVSTEIHPDDVMYNTGKKHYSSVGKSGLMCVLSGLSQSWRLQVERILDLPCGHGRVARHLRAAFPDAGMFFSDLDHEGVDFCSKTFQGTPVYSQPDLTKVDLPSDLDVIWVGSLFTHLDAERTLAWLRHLFGALRPHGILVATFHGLFVHSRLPTHKSGGNPDMDKVLSGFQQSGFGYAPYRSFDMGDYGFSLSTPSAILDMASKIEGARTIAYTERGWANNHDVLILTKNDRLTPFPTSSL